MEKNTGAFFTVCHNNPCDTRGDENGRWLAFLRISGGPRPFRGWVYLPADLAAVRSARRQMYRW
ncbi:MAG: hypothetical protein QNI95_19790, partial [Desulfobacterales bacterium]|nr:hypothetical protein [Desulfobacterales bacterium]